MPCMWEPLELHKSWLACDNLWNTSFWLPSLYLNKLVYKLLTPTSKSWKKTTKNIKRWTSNVYRPLKKEPYSKNTRDLFLGRNPNKNPQNILKGQQGNFAWPFGQFRWCFVLGQEAPRSPCDSPTTIPVWAHRFAWQPFGPHQQEDKRNNVV